MIYKKPVTPEDTMPALPEAWESHKDSIEIPNIDKFYWTLDELHQRQRGHDHQGDTKQGVRAHRRSSDRCRLEMRALAAGSNEIGATSVVFPVAEPGGLHAGLARVVPVRVAALIGRRERGPRERVHARRASVGPRQDLVYPKCHLLALLFEVFAEALLATNSTIPLIPQTGNAKI